MTATLRAAALEPLATPLGPVSRRPVIVAGLLLGIFLSAVEATVVGTALPQIVASLRGIELYGWVVTAYLVTSTVSVPVWGRLSDLHGRRPFYIVGIAIFLLGSILSGAATSMPWLIASRALQGLGAGAIMPIGFTMVADIFDLRERTRIQGLLSSVWGLSSVVGPLVGAVITESLSWRWVFYLNVPFGVAAAGLVLSAWREPPVPHSGRLRILPVVLLTTSVALVLLGVGAEAGPILEKAALGAGVVLGLAFVIEERRSATPILDLRLFENRMFRGVAAGGPFSGVAMFAAITFTPLYVQGVLGESPRRAGEALSFLFFVWMLVSIVAPHAALRLGFRNVAVFGSVFVVGGFGLLALNEAPRFALVATSMALVGTGMGLTISPLMIAVQSSVPDAQRGQATALTQFSRSLGGTLGVALISSVLAANLVADVSRLARERGVPEERVPALTRDVNEVVRDATSLPETERAVLRDALAASLGTAYRLALAAAGVFLVTTFLVPGTLRRPGAG